MPSAKKTFFTFRSQEAPVALESALLSSATNKAHS